MGFSTGTLAAIFITFLLLNGFHHQISVLADTNHYRNSGRIKKLFAYPGTNKASRKGFMPPAPSANRNKMFDTPPPPAPIS
ncbi:hypothetical protein IFM89_006196 [Coptis chinensis]|uniref:Uncharacterized protein n=1 Tax=Coptis chinensis TaxID=261450 RepID=A0A835LID2_9MAGN|nr:hypothetical protein IFM89_006196 [Coptis chinensis]